MSKILAFSGSNRQGSLNQQLVSIAARGAQAAGAEVTVINLADFPMPIFSKDIEKEQGMPEHAARFKQLLLDNDGLLIASPEYNSSYSALLKNAIDWASRANSADEVPLSAFKGKYAVIMAASVNSRGGVLGLLNLRTLLANMGVNVCPNQFSVANAYKAFDQGRLADEIQHHQVRDLGANLETLLDKILEKKPD